MISKAKKLTKLFTTFASLLVTLLLRAFQETKWSPSQEKKRKALVNCLSLWKTAKTSNDGELLPPPLGKIAR